MIEFKTTGRGRPIVLTQHQINVLSRQVGRRVDVELRVLAKSGWFEARTMGELLRTLRRLLGVGDEQTP